MSKKPLGENPYYAIDVDSVIALATKAINPRRVLAGKKLTAGQFGEFVKMVDITWLELCYVFRLDALQLEGCVKAVDLPDKMRQQFLEVLVIYGLGYLHCGAPHLFNQWMRRERESMGFLSPISLLTTQVGRREVSNLIKQDEWSRCKRINVAKNVPLDI